MYLLFWVKLLNLYLHCQKWANRIFFHNYYCFYFLPHLFNWFSFSFVFRLIAKINSKILHTVCAKISSSFVPFGLYVSEFSVSSELPWNIATNNIIANIANIDMVDANKMPTLNLDKLYLSERCEQILSHHINIIFTIKIYKWFQSFAAPCIEIHKVTIQTKTCFF